MIDLFVVFWTVVVFTSVLLSAFQLFDVLFKGGREVAARFLHNSGEDNERT